MAEYELPLTAEGAVTAPDDVLVVTEPSAESETFLDIGPVHTVRIPEFGFGMTDGVNPMRLIVDGGVYDCGGIAPNVAPTLAVNGGSRATVVGTYTGQPADGETIVIALGSDWTRTITFKTTLVTNASGPDFQVLIGADADETYTNLQKLIEKTGTQGTEYWDFYVALQWPTNVFEDVLEISDLSTATPAPGQGTITFRYPDYGALGNAITCTETVTNFTLASGTFTGGVDGTGTAPNAGTYRYFFTWYRSVDGAETFRSLIGTITQTTNTEITVTVTASADTTFDYVNIYRTGKGGVEFFFVGSTPRGTLTYTDGTADTELGGDAYNDDLFREYEQGMPPRGRAITLWKDSIWTLGAHLAAPYSAGTVSVTNDSATVTFSQQGISTLMIGRTFVVTTATEPYAEYNILAVDETAKTATLSRLFEGSTNGTAAFTITDDYDARALRRCIEHQYNQWPENESPGSIDATDPEGGIALIATRYKLFAFSKTTTSALTGDDAETWVLNKISENIGCVATAMAAEIEEGGVFLSHNGFHLISPDEEIVHISSPDTPPGAIAKGLDRTIARINWAAADSGYLFYDEEERKIVAGVPLDGALVPNYEIVFDVQSKTWTLYKRAEWTAVARGYAANGDPVVIAGDRHGFVWHVGIGDSDGFYGTEAVQTLSGAQTVRTLTVSGTPFSTSGDGLDGIPVIVLYADGSTVAYGKVASNTTSAVVLAEDLDTAPAASDQIVVGGIAAQAKSGFSTLGEELRQKILRCATLRHAPQDRGEYYFSFAVDEGSFALCPVGDSTGDLTDTSGKVTHDVQWPGDTHAINIRSFKPGGKLVIRGGIFQVEMEELSDI